MAETVRDVMTKDPMTLDAGASAQEAAKVMRDRDLGDVLVLENGALRGIVTDRDLVVGVMAEGRDPKTTTLSEVASKEVESIAASANIKEAVDLMMKRAMRRLPVVEYDRPVGIVSLGDLAVERDPNSALGQISSSDPNR